MWCIPQYFHVCNFCIWGLLCFPKIVLPTNHPELDYFRSASHEFKVHVHRYGDIQGGYGKVFGCWAKHRLSMDLQKCGYSIWFQVSSIQMFGNITPDISIIIESIYIYICVSKNYVNPKSTGFSSISPWAIALWRNMQSWTLGLLLTVRLLSFSWEYPMI